MCRYQLFNIKALSSWKLILQQGGARNRYLVEVCTVILRTCYFFIENMGLSSKIYSEVLAVTCWKVHFSHINFFSGKPLLIVRVVVNKAASWQAEGKKINMTKSKYGRYSNN